MNPANFLLALRTSPFVGILRDVELKHLAFVAKAAQQGKLGFIEITMNTANAPELIQALRRLCTQYGIEVGAGTVRTMDELNLALDAGAQFVVSPSLDEQIVQRCCKLEVPSLPGALTPTEIQRAYACGATCVKVFPAKSMGGPAYFKELRGPMREIPLLACGGVDVHNAKEYMACGADALAFGGSIFRKDLLLDGHWDKVVELMLALRTSAGY